MAADSASEDGQTRESITTIIRAQIKPEKQQEYEQWLHGINEEATQFAGFQGATILRPDDGSHSHPEYLVVVGFATYSDLRRWEHSTQFAEWQRRLEPLLVDEIAVDALTGTETWFTLPGHTVVVPPPKYKMAVVASFGAAPFVLVVIPLLVQYLKWGIAINRYICSHPIGHVFRHDLCDHLTRLARGRLYPTT